MRNTERFIRKKRPLAVIAAFWAAGNIACAVALPHVYAAAIALGTTVGLWSCFLDTREFVPAMRPAAFAISIASGLAISGLLVLGVYKGKIGLPNPPPPIATESAAPYAGQASGFEMR